MFIIELLIFSASWRCLTELTCGKEDHTTNDAKAHEAPHGDAFTEPLPSYPFANRCLWFTSSEDRAIEANPETRLRGNR